MTKQFFMDQLKSWPFYTSKKAAFRFWRHIPKLVAGQLNGNCLYRENISINFAFTHAYPSTSSRGKKGARYIVGSWGVDS